MRRLQSLVVAASILGVIALGTALPAGAAAQREPVPIVAEVSAPGQAQGDTSGTDVSARVIWTIAGIAGGAVIFGTLYLLKRRVGGFPEHPSWVAPISIMLSSENADESTWGELEPAGAHGSHH